MNATTANKFVNKADVISAKSEHAKKHLLERRLTSKTIKFLTSLP